MEGVGDRGRLGYLGHQDNLHHRRKIHGCVCCLLSRLDFAEHLSMPGRAVPVRSCKLMGSKLLQDMTEEQTEEQTEELDHSPVGDAARTWSTLPETFLWNVHGVWSRQLRIACASRACF